MASYLIDTNIWRYLFDTGSSSELFRLAKKNNEKIVIAPSVLYEIARMQDVSTRDGILRLVTDKRVNRLMPEAYSQSEEMIGEVTRLRRNWLNENADQAWYRRIRHDWRRSKGGIWDRFRSQPQLAVSFLELSEEDQVQEMREKFESQRSQAKQYKVDFSEFEIDKFTTQLEGADCPAEYRNVPFPYWRAASFREMTVNLSMGPNSPYKEWLSGRLNLAVVNVNNPSWVKFWLEDVSPEQLPRFWVSAAFEILQVYRKTSPGTVADTQLSNYLVDVDYVVSADRLFCEVTSKVHSQCPFRIAEPIRLKGGAAGIEELFELMS
tara:strand:+ start:91 stop:1056 length:966 start_codon:yes stop_codon:yes gene_type:complete